MNIQGLRKYNDSAAFRNYCKTFDVIALYETWQEHEAEFVDFINGYETFEAMRKEKARYVERVWWGVRVCKGLGTANRWSSANLSKF